MSQPAPTPIAIAGIPLPPNLHLDFDPLDGGHHCLLAVTAPDGVSVAVRLWVPEAEREDWRKLVGVLRGVEVSAPLATCLKQGSD